MKIFCNVHLISFIIECAKFCKVYLLKELWEGDELVQPQQKPKE